MNPSICLRWLLVLCFSGLALIRADDDTAKNKATDIAQMKKIFDALTAYKKAKGDFPPHLSDLVPEYLPDAKVLLSPLDVADPPAPPRGRDPKNSPAAIAMSSTATKWAGTAKRCAT